ncbi:aminotransferase class III-fold pyridoxal phosphate-dependent enzyme [Streptomyces sp. NPDC000151]|uniref:aspartate aminotransferase family protein n=1 Tax=Streptomyces sp. NPDC000151 TaxID=3154244 RepID=UPI0033174BC9
MKQLDRLIEEQEKLLMDRTTASARLREEARESLAGGVASAWQDGPPVAVWIEDGHGAHVRDVDGTDYVDLHGGFGVGLAGHAHPAIVAAVTERVQHGTHFAQPTRDLIPVTRLLADRFGLPQWRFTNSGTEATMDAVHLMRAATGRRKILKVEGSYHGHHDSVQVSIYARGEGDIGPDDRPRSVPYGPAYPTAVTDLTLVVPFGDLDAVERVLAEHGDDIAGMIIEPIMMNIGLIVPPDGYHAGLKQLLHRHGAYLAYDEVKTGFAVAPGGATQLFGVTPDIICLAKSMGGGIPCGAVGATRDLMAKVADNTYEQVGTFNGNPMMLAATHAVLTEVLTDAAYRHFDALRHTMVSGVEAAMARHGLPGYVAAHGAKGSVIFTERLRDFRDFLAYDDRWGHLHWLYQHNGGVFLPPWGKTEQWTLSVQHTAGDVERFVRNFERFAAAVHNVPGGAVS